jgi:hypothetical protein
MTLATRTTTKKADLSFVYRLFLLIFSFFSVALYAEEGASSPTPQAYPFFIPPENWEIVETRFLSPKVLIGFMEKGKKGFCPSMNLAIEKVNVSLNEYVQAVKKLHEIDTSTRWRDVGKLKISAGTARITEIDTKSKWGPVRMLQMIFIKDTNAYILTAAAPKEDFARLYPSIKKAFSSFTLSEDLLSFVKDPQKSELLKEKILLLKGTSQRAADPENKDHPARNEWVFFAEYLTKEHADMGALWQLQILQMIQNEIAHSL